MEQLENRVGRLETDMTEVKIELAEQRRDGINMKEVVDKNNKILEQLNATMIDIQIVLTKLTGEMTYTNNEITELKSSQKAEEERGTIHIMDWIKKYWLQIVLGTIVILEIVGDADVTKILAIFH